MTEDEETMHEIRIGRIFECEFCYEEFDEDSQYRIHLEKHMKPWVESVSNNSGEVKSCELCGEKLRIKPLDHLKFVHKVTKDLKKNSECYICLLEHEPYAFFFSNEGIRIHIKKKHEEDDWKFCCFKCNSRLKRPDCLSWHLESFHRISNPKAVFNGRKRNGLYLLVGKVKS